MKMPLGHPMARLTFITITLLGCDDPTSPEVQTLHVPCTVPEQLDVAQLCSGPEGGQAQYCVIINDFGCDTHACVVDGKNSGVCSQPCDTASPCPAESRCEPGYLGDDCDADEPDCYCVPSDW
jgi:hypothetical protein